VSGKKCLKGLSDKTPGQAKEIHHPTIEINLEVINRAVRHLIIQINLEKNYKECKNERDENTQGQGPRKLKEWCRVQDKISIIADFERWGALPSTERTVRAKDSYQGAPPPAGSYCAWNRDGNRALIRALIRGATRYRAQSPSCATKHRRAPWFRVKGLGFRDSCATKHHRAPWLFQI
jgi:hypothetical protein